MRRQIGLLLLLGFVGLPVAGAPVKASAGGDLCIQISGAGCDLSGDLGFFHFKGKLPKKQFVALHGRACGVGPAYGTAIVNSEGNGVEIGATFFCDAVQGQFLISFPLGSRIGDTGWGYASYGNYDVLTSCDAELVDCALEP